jgi:hypothetical protein
MGINAGRTICLALMLAVMHAGAATAEPHIAWQVENPFRFFLDPADTQVHRATWLSLSDLERNHPVQSAERALSERHPDGWSAFTFTKTCWDGKRNRYSCRERADYLNPKSHTILARLDGVDDAQSVDCSWLTLPQGQARGPRIKAVTLPCDTPVQLSVPYPIGAWISVEIGGSQVAETAARITDLFILGMGDSFASGEGNPDLPVRLSSGRTTNYGITPNGTLLSGYPARIGDWQDIGDAKFMEESARWQDEACHRSLYSHQLRAALQLAIEDPHRAVTFAGFGCSGADTTNGLFLQYKGNEWTPHAAELPQISAAAEAQCDGKGTHSYVLPKAYHLNDRIPELKGATLRTCEDGSARKIDLLLVSIGGNDVGFSRLVANAVLNDESVLRRLGGWFGQVHGLFEAGPQLDALDDRLKSLNRALHTFLHVPLAESERIILTGYPPMALLDDGKSVCPDGQAGMTVLPEFFLGEAKAQLASTISERLNDVMRESAHQHSWSFVEGHRATFRGRGLCVGYSDAPWMMTDELRVPRKVNGTWEPFNPSHWRAYAARQRLFRTPNDAFMTGNFHVPKSLVQTAMSMQGYGWVQLLLASVYSGAFHPTAEGQAAIADAVVVQARAVLAKYENRSMRSSPKRVDLGLVDESPRPELASSSLAQRGRREATKANSSDTRQSPR